VVLIYKASIVLPGIRSAILQCGAQQILCTSLIYRGLLFLQGQNLPLFTAFSPLFWHANGEHFGERNSAVMMIALHYKSSRDGQKRWYNQVWGKEKVHRRRLPTPAQDQKQFFGFLRRV
jgi:hypothetical protein